MQQCLDVVVTRLQVIQASNRERLGRLVDGSNNTLSQLLYVTRQHGNGILARLVDHSTRLRHLGLADDDEQAPTRRRESRCDFESQRLRLWQKEEKSEKGPTED